MRIVTAICVGLLLSAAVPAQAELLRVSGRVTAAQGGQGLAGIDIRAHRQGQATLIATTDANGDYSATADMPAGTYRLSAQSPATQYYVGKIHPDTTCYGVCRPGSWGTTAFTVPSAQPATQVNFSLALGGRLQLSVKATDTNLPLADAIAFFSNSDSDGANELRSGADGLIPLGPVPVNSYTVRATAPNGYISELYNGIHCSAFTSNCSPINATQVAVTAAATVPVAFSLERGITIRGRLLGPQGEPVAGTVSVYERSGGTPVSAVAWAYAGDDGYYETNDSLPPRQYGLIASSRDGNYSATVYPNVACSVCDPRGSGAAVSVGAQSVSGINFTMQAAATIRGHVSLPDDGFAYLPRLHSATTLQEVSASYSETDGSYRYSGLLPGSYYVSVQPTLDFSFLGELYNGVPCPIDQPCELNRGTPITVTAGAVADHIDLRIRSDVIFADGLQLPPP